MATVTKKDKFFDVLKNIFIGAKIEGESGYVNLMRIKSTYYQEFKDQLLADIEAKLNVVGKSFEEELYNKLYTFFKKYFSESGSIYFSYTPLQEKVYERIYRDDKDVMLFWKTHMLYYVKTERLYKNLEIQDENTNIFYLFDVCKLEHKKNNERKDLVFDFANAEFKDNKRQITLTVEYSKKNKKTKIHDILNQIKKAEKVFDSLTEKQVERACGIFRKQSEVDYFINKNAKEFLREQFSLWIKGYLMDDETLFEADRLKQLKALQSIAFNIIDLVSQFEDELVKIWNKPKFAHSSNYVITLDKIAERDFALLKKIIEHKGMESQLKEWQELGIIDKSFKAEEIVNENKLNEKWQYLPLDTKYFKNLELDILALFDDLDNQLDGWLIHSENYQALNTIKEKYRNKIQTIYIDPPFNLEGSDQFAYRTNYKDNDWLTLLENRISLAYSFINKTGGMFTRCDYHGNMYVRLLLNSIFGQNNLVNEIIVNRGKQRLGGTNIYSNATDSLFFFSKSDEFILSPFKRERYDGEAKGTNMLMKGDRRPPEREFVDPEGNKVTLLPPPNSHWKFKQSKIDEMYRKGIMYLAKSQSGLNSGIRKVVDGNEIPVDYVPSFLFDDAKTIDSNWTDITGYSADWGFVTENSEVLLQRAISSSTNGKTKFVMDFFMGSGTTVAVSQKLLKKWIGVEMSEKFFQVVLPRMKKVLNGEQKGISRNVEWKGGGFFKYLSFEQYEEVLNETKYEDKNALPNQDIYHQYIFLKDLKLTDEVLKVDDESKKIKVDLTKLHEQIDIPETLSHLTGKFIKQILKEKVVFTDGDEIYLNNIDYKIVKPLIWW